MRSLSKPFVSLVIMLVVAGTIVYANKNQTALKTPSAAKFARSLPDDSRSVLENCDKLTLYSLKPFPTHSENGKPDPGTFEDYPIVGKMVVPAKQRAAVLAQLYNGLTFPDNAGIPGCFNPHHALRAVKGKCFVDIVICFGCMQMQVFTEKRPDQMTTGISSEPRPALDRILKDGKVKLSE